MRFFFFITAIGLLASCSSRQHAGYATNNQTSEVHLVVNQLRWGPNPWGEPPSPNLSNRLFQLRHIAIPVLVARASSLTFDNAEIDRLGVACRILGTNAYPILDEVAKMLGSEDPSKRGAASILLQRAGPISFWPIIQFLQSTSDLPEPGLPKDQILYFAPDYPRESINELFRLYHLTGKSPQLKTFIDAAFRETLYPEDCELLTPTLAQLLKHEDSSIVSSILAYLKRCGRLPAGLKEDVTRLLESPNPEVRTAATNVMKLPLQHAKQVSE